MAGDPALLDALAAGGKRAAEAYQAGQAATDQTTNASIRAALSSSVAQQASPGAQYDLARLQQVPRDLASDLAAKQAYTQMNYINSLGEASKPFYDNISNLLIPAYQRQLAEQQAGGSGGGSGGGGGGGGSGGRSGGSGGRSKSGSATDWIDQLRADAGLVGTGIRTKTGAPEYLRAVSLQGVAKGSPTDRLPRDLRERQYLESQYGAPSDQLDKAAPISGFLKKALDQLESAAQNKISYERYRKDTQAAARKLKGDQSRAVQYALLLAQQQLGGVTGPGVGEFRPGLTPVSPEVSKAVARVRLF